MMMTQIIFHSKFSPWFIITKP